MKNIKKRLTEWKAIQRVQRHVEDGAITGGDAGEQEFLDLLRSHSRAKHVKFYTERRLPSRKQNRKREIDLIICTPSEIHLLEIKNWSGFVQESENSWRQKKRNGDFVDHRNPVSENSRKISAFVEYLSDSGTELSEGFVDSRIRAQIILFNERLNVSPEISKNPDVIQRKELDQFLDETCRVSALQSNTRRLIDKCFNEQLSDRIQKILFGGMPRSTYRKVCHAISQANTWDRLALYGCKTLKGDLLRLHVNQKFFTRKQLSDGTTIEVNWKRHRFWGGLLSLTGLGALGKMKIQKESMHLSTNDKVDFHVVGEPKPRTIMLSEIDSIHIG